MKSKEELELLLNEHLYSLYFRRGEILAGALNKLADSVPKIKLILSEDLELLKNIENDIKSVQSQLTQL